MKKAEIINGKDSVATALRDLKKGDAVTVNSEEKQLEIILKDDINLGHKFALKDIDDKENVYKYGEIIGVSTEKISQGEHVHVHNIKSRRGRGDLEN